MWQHDRVGLDIKVHNEESQEIQVNIVDYRD